VKALPGIRRVLVANRGEVAVRIIRACRDLGIEAVAVYSEVDRDSYHVQLADRAVCIGPRQSAASYLNIPALITAARMTEADAVHPGYGFLAENAEFAAACAEHGLIFIGPPPDAIRAMGDKALARRTAARLGVPVIPGSEGVVSTAADLAGLARQVGFPLLLKAAAGGGGRGMRLVRTPEELEAAWHRARAEAGAAFGRDEVYLERFLERVRHVEVQVLADGHGRAVHLGERECSLQRRHQKVVEEAPSPAVDPCLRERLAAAALAICRGIGYRGAGTVEFVVDAVTGQFYFIEMNTRLQVEHPVTELITGVDIVVEQIRLAAGEPLSFRQEDVTLRGHALECRVLAEDPDRGFLPCPGRIAAYQPPAGPGVRLDSHCYPGYAVPPDYDSLLAKVVTWGPDRHTAIRRMARALAEYRIEGVATNIPFLRQLMAHPDFLAGHFHTHWLEETFLARGEG
jgi:acetyl-CoA carboxylase biotin carboxylase subunit